VTTRRNGAPPKYKADINTCNRFVCTPIPDVQKRLQAESEALTKEMSNLDKKEDYLEKTYTNSKNSLEQVLKGAS
jgi:prefoldin subunit 1